ncbi:MAG: hypothetical protein ACK6A9_09980 [Dolichospermum sp.]
MALKIVVIAREQGTGNRKEVSDNFTFRYLTYVGFFPFTYLLKYLTVTEKKYEVRIRITRIKGLTGW